MTKAERTTGRVGKLDEVVEIGVELVISFCGSLDCYVV